MGKVATTTDHQQMTQNGLGNFFEQLFKSSSPSVSTEQTPQQNVFASINQMLQGSSMANYFQALPFMVATNAAMMSQFTTNEQEKETPIVEEKQQQQQPLIIVDQQQSINGNSKRGSSSFTKMFTAEDDDNNNVETAKNRQDDPPSSTTNSEDGSPKAKKRRVGPQSSLSTTKSNHRKQQNATSIQQQTSLSPSEDSFPPSAQFESNAFLSWMQMMAAVASAGNSFPLLAAMAASGIAAQQDGLPMFQNLFSSEQHCGSTKQSNNNNNSKGDQQQQSLQQQSQQQLSSVEGRQSVQPQVSSQQSIDSQPKRARTRIGDDQLKVLRQYFDINNSPSEEQIKEMAEKANLPEKVIKHWFRNTLFKERQRNLDSPYNFSIPPQMGIDLATYQKTGQAKIISVKQEENTDETVLNDEELKKQQEQQSFPIKNDGSNNGIAADDSPKDGQKITCQLNMTMESSSAQSSRLSTPISATTTPKIEQNDSKGLQSMERNNVISDEHQAQMDIANSVFTNFNKAMAMAFQNQQQNRQHQNSVNHNLFSSLFDSSINNNGDSKTEVPSSGSSEQFTSIISNGGIPGMVFPFIPTGVLSSNIPSGMLSQHASSPGQQLQAYGTPFSTPPPGPSNTITGCPSTLTHISGATGLPNSLMSSSMGSGRRANRTRFTDSQLKRLQNFFDKQAYPKDEDVEYLSNTLKLSPRVIVVWFQNARQKARKVYENHPNMAAASAGALRNPVVVGGTAFDMGRIGRNAGSGFQCKRCEQFFARYFELIHHQQQLCYKGDADAQHSDNKSMEENLSDEERANSRNTTYMDDFGQKVKNMPINFESFSTVANIMHATNPFNSLFASVKLPTETIANNTDHQNFKTEDGGDEQKQVEQECLRGEERGKQEIATTSNGFSNYVEAINGEEANSPLDLSKPSITESSRFGLQQNFFGSDGLCSAASISPVAYSYSAEENDEDGDGSQSSFGQSGDFSTTKHFKHSSFVGADYFRDNQISPAQGQSKRFRTHLTPMQVYIMKSLFNVYKTPSMAECELLGSKIGLQRRVVQVWFQNARAKERKSTCDDMGPLSLTTFSVTPMANTTRCELCDVPFDAHTSFQDHIFNEQHIENIKQFGNRFAGIGSSSTIANDGEVLSNEKSSSQQKNHQAEQLLSTAVSEQRKMPSDLHSRNALLANSSPIQSLMLNSMGTGTIPSFLCNPMDLQSTQLSMATIVGTPVHSLTIPKSIQEQITADMLEGKESTTFTQDGLELTELKNKLQAHDFKTVECVDSEVGWACTQCTNVFQHLNFLRNHQRLVCVSCEGEFRLIQSHYQCKVCNAKFGTQDEYFAHCQSEEHKNAVASQLAEKIKKET